MRAIRSIFWSIKEVEDMEIVMIVVAEGGEERIVKQATRALTNLGV